MMLAYFTRLRAAAALFLFLFSFLSLSIERETKQVRHFARLFYPLAHFSLDA